MMKEALKRLVPPALWEPARKQWHLLLDGMRDAGPYVRRRSYCEFTLYYNRGNSVVRRLAKESMFEERMCRAITDELKNHSKPVFLDIGANIGLISMYVASNAPQATIYAFEPGPVQREFLEMTVDKNGLSERMTVHKEALGKSSGTATFYAHDPKYVAGDGFVDTGRARDAHPITVDVVTVDEWWSRVGKPPVHAVKLDTEGSELFVLEGAVTFLTACRPVVFMEIEPRNLRVYPHDHFDVLKFIKSRGYSLATLDGTVITEDNFDFFIKAGKDTYVARPD